MLIVSEVSCVEDAINLWSDIVAGRELLSVLEDNPGGRRVIVVWTLFPVRRIEDDAEGCE